uniref:Uncharacterized protein n=1 Tax=Moniliophthora roreri TaxID=221103 RepID=A0A0W0F3R5_MONRR
MSMSYLQIFALAAYLIAAVSGATVTFNCNTIPETCNNMVWSTIPCTLTRTPAIGEAAGKLLVAFPARTGARGPRLLPHVSPVMSFPSPAPMDLTPPSAPTSDGSLLPALRLAASVLPNAGVKAVP